MEMVLLVLHCFLSATAVWQGFDSGNLSLNDLNLSQTRLAAGGQNSLVNAGDFVKIDQTLLQSLIVRVDAAAAYSPDLPPGWTSTTAASPSNDRLANRSAAVSSPQVNGTTIFNTWTVVNQAKWNEVAYQWLYGGQQPLFNSSALVTLALINFNETVNTTFEVPLEPAVDARAARRQFSLGAGNIIVADFNMWFGDCSPDYSGDMTHVNENGNRIDDTLGVKTFLETNLREAAIYRYCTREDQQPLAYFNVALQSPWASVNSSLQAVELSFASDWFVQVEDADNTRSCCGPAESAESPTAPVPYAEQGVVLLEMELVSGTVLNESLRTWAPIPYADKGTLQAPRNEAVTLSWSNTQCVDIRRVRAVWQVEKGFNQG